MIYKERGQARHLSSSDNIKTTLCLKPGKGNHMSGEASYDPAPFYVLNLKYVFEGILTPTIGLIGIIGIETTSKLKIVTQIFHRKPCHPYCSILQEA